MIKIAEIINIILLCEEFDFTTNVRGNKKNRHNIEYP